MRRTATQQLCAACRHGPQPRLVVAAGQRRAVHIRPTPSTSEPQQSLDPSAPSSLNSSADARFEVLGSPFSLLSASLSPSQSLFARKGTLVGFNGKPENAVSTLSLLEPFRRALVGVPFLYQKISSTSPFTALISTKSAITSLAVVHLDGRVDWMIAQRNALLAWTGHTLRLSPRWNTKLGLAHWGSTTAHGRGLLALSGKGAIHQIALKSGEEYIVHPSNVIAYSLTTAIPQPYRFRSSALRLQLPGYLTWLPDTRFWRTMRESTAWRVVRNVSFWARTWLRRTIWGDRLFLHFRGPTTILLQSRGAPLAEVLTADQVNELADSPAGSVAAALAPKPLLPPAAPTASPAPTKVNFASVGADGAVKFEKASKPSD